MRVAIFAGWVASIAAHAAVLAVAVWLLGGESDESMLFIDLTEPAPAGASAGGSPGTAASSTGSGTSASSPASTRKKPATSASSVASPKRAQVPETTVSTPSRVEDHPKPADPAPAVAVEAPKPPTAAAQPAPPTPARPATSDATASATEAPSAGGGTTESGAGRRDSGASAGQGDAGGPATGAPGTGGGGGQGSPSGEGHGTALARTSTGPGDGTEERPYHELLRRHIRDTLEYPSVVRRRGLTGTVEIEFFVRADGVIRDVTLARSSSSRTLDDAAVAAVKQLPRLRFPPGLPPRAFRVLVPVVFDVK